MWPSEGSLVVGPIEPATKRGLALVENCCATSRASLTAARLISRTRSARSNSVSTVRVAPKVLVSTTSQPTSQKTGVDVADDVGTAQDQDFAAVFFSPVVVERGLAELDVGAHGAVVNYDAVADELEKVGHWSVVSRQFAQIVSSLSSSRFVLYLYCCRIFLIFRLARIEKAFTKGQRLITRSERKPLTTEYTAGAQRTLDAKSEVLSPLVAQLPWVISGGSPIPTSSRLNTAFAPMWAGAMASNCSLR